MKCLMCFKTLVPIGHSRKNGAHHKDWGTRKYHKMCSQELVLCEMYYDVSYAFKDAAKALGAQYNPHRKQWFAPNTSVARNLRNAKFEMMV